MGAALAELALVHDEDGVGGLNGAEAVGDEDAGAAGDHAGEGEADAVFGVGVDGAGGLVEDEDGGRVGEGAGEADELLLAGGEGGAAFADGLVEAGREGADEVGDVDFFGGVLDVFVGDPAGAEADVVGDGAGEEERVLEDDAEAAAEGGEVLFADVDAVDENLAVLDVVEAHHEGDDGGLAGSGVADDGGGFAGGDGEGDAAEDPFDVGENGVVLRRKVRADEVTSDPSGSFDSALRAPLRMTALRWCCCSSVRGW